MPRRKRATFAALLVLGIGACAAPPPEQAPAAEPAGPEQGSAEGIVGTSWEVRAYDDGSRELVGVAEGTSLSATFGSDGRISGSAGCNDFSASYRIDGESIAIGPAAATRKMCPGPEGIMQQEAAFLAALSSAAAYRIEGDRLHLRSAGGDPALELTAGSAPPR